MQQLIVTLLGVGLPLLAGLLVASWGARRLLGRARQEAAEILAVARLEADGRQKELLVSAQEKALAIQEEAARAEREIEEREQSVEQRSQQTAEQAAELGRARRATERRAEELERRAKALAENEARVSDLGLRGQAELARIAGLTAQQARQELTASVEAEARGEAARLARKIEDEARENAEREALQLVVQAAQRVSLRDALESTVSFIELPNDDMKGRIIGKEGRNIRALEMATGIDLIVDDTPRSIWISCFDPLRREIARLAIDKLLEDGRIHPARIEEVVQRVREEIEVRIDEKGQEAAFSLGIVDLHPKLVRLVGRTRYHTTHGQNLLQHCLETSLVGGHMALELGAQSACVQRAGLLHEIGQVAEGEVEHPLVVAAELAVKYGESEGVVHAIRALHPDVQPRSVEALLLITANRISESRPGARKENLAVFIERLRRLEAIAGRFPGVQKAYAVKAGRDLRVLVDVKQVGDEAAYDLSRQIARALERELSYPGQIKVSVVRETRAVRYAV